MCSDNNITPLDGGPQYVGKDFSCGEKIKYDDNTEISDLSGGPVTVGGIVEINCVDITRFMLATNIKDEG